MAPVGPEIGLLFLAPLDGPPFPGDCWPPLFLFFLPWVQAAHTCPRTRAHVAPQREA